jgi:hypothetical protein
MDISIRDKLLDNLQIELGYRKNMLKDKYNNITELSTENNFLTGVKDNYKQHYDYIKKIKEEQYRSMSVLADYLDNLLEQTDGADKSINKAKSQQKKIVTEMNKIQKEIDDIVTITDKNTD